MIYIFHDFTNFDFDLLYFIYLFIYLFIYSYCFLYLFIYLVVLCLKVTSSVLFGRKWNANIYMHILVVEVNLALTVGGHIYRRSDD